MPLYQSAYITAPLHSVQALYIHTTSPNTRFPQNQTELLIFSYSHLHVISFYFPNLQASQLEHVSITVFTTLRSANYQDMARSQINYEHREL